MKRRSLLRMLGLAPAAFALPVQSLNRQPAISYNRYTRVAFLVTRCDPQEALFSAAWLHVHDGPKSQEGVVLPSGELMVLMDPCFGGSHPLTARNPRALFVREDVWRQYVNSLHMLRV